MLPAGKRTGRSPGYTFAVAGIHLASNYCAQRWIGYDRVAWTRADAYWKGPNRFQTIGDYYVKIVEYAC